MSSDTDSAREALEGVDEELSRMINRAVNSDAKLERLPAFRAFRSQIDRYPLLSAQGQSELFERVAAGREAREQIADLEAQDNLTSRERVTLQRARKKVREADEALEYLIGSNLRLVITIAGELAAARMGDRAWTQLPDIVQEGNLGLMEAVERYNPSHGVPFATYAAYYIRERVRKALAADKPMTVPISWTRVARIAAGISNKLVAELGRDPTIDEIRQAVLEYCIERTYERGKAQTEEEALEVLKTQGTLSAIRKLDEVLNYTQRAVELDAPVGDDSGGTTIGDLQYVEDDTAGAFDSAELAELREALFLALGGLKEREREIILLRYGFVDNERWTYARLGERFGVTAERIRQIEQKVLKRLSSPHAQYVHLSSFLDSQIDRILDEEDAAATENALDGVNAADIARARMRGAK